MADVGIPRSTLHISVLRSGTWGPEFQPRLPTNLHLVNSCHRTCPSPAGIVTVSPINLSAGSRDRPFRTRVTQRVCNADLEIHPTSTPIGNPGMKLVIAGIGGVLGIPNMPRPPGGTSSFPVVLIRRGRIGRPGKDTRTDDDPQHRQDSTELSLSHAQASVSRAPLCDISAAL